jgi:5-methylcytosine-specific restriction endonuclease McrA
MKTFFARIYTFFFGSPTVFGAKRSSKWAKLRDSIVKEIGRCPVCNGIDFLTVHHIIPFHLNPELELNRDNLVVLCENPKMNCHFIFGHRRNWKDYNKNILEDIKVLRKIIHGSE